MPISETSTLFFLSIPAFLNFGLARKHCRHKSNNNTRPLKSDEKKIKLAFKKQQKLHWFLI